MTALIVIETADVAPVESILEGFRSVRLATFELLALMKTRIWYPTNSQKEMMSAHCSWLSVAAFEL